MIKIGDRVKCINSDVGAYYPGLATVRDISGSTISVQRDDHETGAGIFFAGHYTWKISIDSVVIVSKKTIEQLQQEPVTIGSDPEFIFVDPRTKSQVDASDIISDGISKSFGYDGHNSTGEIRPAYTHDPLKHADNIRRLLLKARKDTKKAFTLDMVSATTHASVGGHIHIGHPLLLQDSDMRHKLQIAFDSLLSFPIMYVENIDNAIHRKCGGGYGQLGDMRTAPWGIEYRSPASWLTSEKYTRGVLALAYCIADDVIRHNHGISKPMAEMRGFREAYSSHATDILKPLLAYAITEIHKLTLYPKYKIDIDYILYHAKRGDDLQTGEIKHGWHIPYIHTRRIILYTLLELIKHMSQDITKTNLLRSYHTFVSYSSSDYMIPEIATRINKTLTKILTKKIERPDMTTGIGLFAIKKESGNVIMIQYNPSIYTAKRMKRLARIIADTSKAMRFSGLDIQVHPRDISVSRGADNCYRSPLRIGLGRPLREYKSYLAETLVFLCLCYANNTIYRTFRMSKKTGKKVSIHLLTKNLLKTIAPLTKKTKTLSLHTDDDTAMYNTLSTIL